MSRLKKSTKYTRVISGNFKFKKITAPSPIKGKNSITPQKVKEAAFEIIKSENSKQLENTIFIDLFSGSGQIGIEAISRGYPKIIFCDQAAIRLANIRNWLSTNKVENKMAFLNRNAFSFFKQLCSSEFHEFLSIKLEENALMKKSLVIFADPPYNMVTEKRISAFIKSFQQLSLENYFDNIFFILQVASKVFNANKFLAKSSHRIYKYNNTMLLSFKSSS